MTEAELDHIYSRLCHAMTAAGESQAPLLLARFALLAMSAIGDPAKVQALIEDSASIFTRSGAAAPVSEQ